MTLKEEKIILKRFKSIYKMSPLGEVIKARASHSKAETAFNYY